jgi:heme/copper-type cytochrome/quinol oxidase subunit 1
VTFLVQHAMGTSGMPRRIYEYAEGTGWAGYNMVSTIGSFILGLGVLLTVINIAYSIKRGAKAGPDPWKANTLEWYPTSPPPEHNFDVIPRIRSVEPMKDIRRQVEQATGVQQRHAASRALAE